MFIRDHFGIFWIICAILIKGGKKVGSGWVEGGEMVGRGWGEFGERVGRGLGETFFFRNAKRVQPRVTYFIASYFTDYNLIYLYVI